jgi:uncharacterized repeat protein (TIGR01451 family)
MRRNLANPSRTLYRLRFWLLGIVVAIATIFWSIPVLTQFVTLPSNPSLIFQTSGQARCANVGDWYTTNGSAIPLPPAPSPPSSCNPPTAPTSNPAANRIHLFAVDITQASITAGGGSATISVIDAESGGALDEIGDGTPVGRPATAPFGTVTCTTLPSTCDPTRFELRAADRTTVLDTRTIGTATGSIAADGSTVTFTVTAPGTYFISSVTGAGPIFGDPTVALNDDDNGFRISIPDPGVPLIGQFQGSLQQNTGATLTTPLFFLVGPGTGSLFLRNFDLDADAIAGQGVGYVDPAGATRGTPTTSANGTWNNGGDLNTGGDTIGGLTLTSAAGPGDAGLWRLDLTSFATGNQSLFEANSDLGRLPLFDAPPGRAGNFVLTPSGTLATTIGNSVDHPFTVTNNFFTNDIINLALTGTDPNYTVQLLTAGGTPLTDNDGDGILDTGILTPGQTSSFILRVTPNAGATGPDNTTVTGTSFMDRRVAPATFATRAQSVVKTTTIPVATAAIGDTVFSDLNGNGIQDVGEPGFAGVTVTLQDAGGATVATTTTNATGNYQFTGLTAQTYTVTITPPAGFTTTTTNPLTVPLASGQTVTTADFGLRATGIIGDTVFNDFDGDGIQDPGEPGIGGVTVTLTDASGVPRTVITDANGNYQFQNVPPGAFTVTVTPPANFANTTPGTRTGTLIPGGVDLDQDFGLRLIPGTIGDTVFNDLDGDGVQDAGEPGIGGVTLTLTGTDANGQPVTQTTTTNAAGNYSFTTLPGTYTVTATPPAGTTATTPNPITNIILGPGGNIPTVDFGFTLIPGQVGDRVFDDFNGNGVQDANEPGLLGVTVTLTGTDVLGNPVTLTTTTDATGTYRFTGVPASSAAGYTVTITPPAGYTELTTPGGATQTFPFPAGSSLDTVDFGLRRPPATIGNVVFSDPNNNGVQDGGEPGLSGATLTLRDPAGNIVATTTTDATGNYRFTNVPPGTYSVTATPPAGFGGTTPNPQTVTVTAGQVLTTANFGLRQLPGSITGNIFSDQNGSGVRDPNEPGVPGIVLTLLDANGNVVATTVADVNGNYAFLGVPPGSYTVRITPPPGLTLTTSATFPVTLGNGQVVTNINFGLRGGPADSLILVKRITNVTRQGNPVGGLNFATFVDDPNTANDNAPGWAQLSPVGLPNVEAANALLSGDEITYTVYFLVNSTSPLNDVNLCDLIPTGTTFVPNSTQVRIGSASPALGGTFFSPLAPLPQNNACSDQGNPNGAAVFNLGTLSNAPGNNVGFIRFRVRID